MKNFFKDGDIVLTKSHSQTKPKWNDKIGFVIKYHFEFDMWEVLLTGEIEPRFFRGHNLVKINNIAG